MKSRLRKVANNVSPSMHREVEKHILDKDGNRWRLQQADPVFLLSKRILAALPIVPTNERVYDLAERITNGEFADICDVAQADNPELFKQYVEKTKMILKNSNVLI